MKAWLVLGITALICAGFAHAQEVITPPGMVLIEQGEVWVNTEKEQIKLTLKTFYIDRAEVTHAQFDNCVKAGVCRRYRLRYNKNLDTDDLPEIDLSPVDAARYCRWAGKRLPTEAEWVRAARGDEDQRAYPWGVDSPAGRANFVNAPPLSKGGRTWRFLFPVCSHELGNSPFGLCDMAGNASEWTIAAGHAESGALDPNGFVEKGGGFLSTSEKLKIDLRSPAPHVLYRSYETGFRCAKGAD